MSSANPFKDLQDECDRLLENALSKAYPEKTILKVPSKAPTVSEFGEYASSICFELAKMLKRNPIELANEIVKHIDLSKSRLIERVEAAGAGYINFYANFPTFSKFVIESAVDLDTSYGYVKTNSPSNTIVEHTSANPNGPIHIGTSRNSILGDSLARVLRARGHNIKTHFYIDDMGKQIAVVSYGYKLLGEPKPTGKAHLWIGIVYAITSCVTEIKGLQKKLKTPETQENVEERNKIQREMDDWIAAAADLRTANPMIFDELADKIKKEDDPEEYISNLVSRYENDEKEAKRLMRNVVNYCLNGFKEIFQSIGIAWDFWDWESDLVWSGRVSEIIERLSKSGYMDRKDGALVLNVEQIIENLNLRKILEIPEGHEIPPLVLVRSDGTTLYTTRDMAYTFLKFELADKVINVIGVDQTLAQKQLKAAFCLLDSPEKAKNLIHYAYEMVQLPGYKMSRRRGRYISLDEILEEATKKAYEEVCKRSPELNEDEKRKISRAVGIGAIKYAIISVVPQKPVLFTWDKVLNFEINSAPFIQYAHARACNLLKKAGEIQGKADFGLLKDSKEHKLVLSLAKFPNTFIETADNLKPSLIAEYANILADEFNSFYASLPVIKAENTATKNARLSLVKAVKIALRNALDLLGIEAPDRM